ILLQLNWLAVELGVASLALVAIYPFMKRVTWWPQAWLGLTFNWGAVMGYAAESGRIDATAIVLYAGCFFWTLGYDTIYALQDIDDDALAGVKSTARLFGREAKRFVVMFYAASFALLATAGLAAHLGPLFLILLLPAGAHLVWQARELDIASAASALRLFRANRNAGALAAAAFFVAGWLQ
ncbi:MAG TPA: UbiA family prenyltransferase, partial [Rhizomicrobium sp.]|nr:UbiA family prenyltransferase [Rhizomicrobium sp.]